MSERQVANEAAAALLARSVLVISFEAHHLMLLPADGQSYTLLNVAEFSRKNGTLFLPASQSSEVRSQRSEITGQHFVV
jgi:hypothetical protein